MKLNEFAKQFPSAFSAWLNESNITLEQLAGLNPVWRPDWDKVPSWVNWISVNSDREFAYRSSKPYLKDDCKLWFEIADTENSKVVYIDLVPENEMGNWQEMIYERPQFEPDWSKAPDWAKRLLIDVDGKSWWSIGEKDDLEDGEWSSLGKCQSAGIIKNAPKNFYERPQDDIDWSLLPDWINYVAIDIWEWGRCVYGYSNKPVIFKYSGGNQYWEGKPEYTMLFAKYAERRRSAFSNHYLTNVKAADSLRQRPQEK